MSTSFKKSDNISRFSEFRNINIDNNVRRPTQDVNYLCFLIRIIIVVLRGTNREIKVFI